MEENQYHQENQAGTPSAQEHQAGKASGGMQPGRSGTSNRGFASMSPERQREIASKGGKAAHKSGNAHEWNSEQAREAGRKGGQASGGSRDRQNRDARYNGQPE